MDPPKNRRMHAAQEQKDRVARAVAIFRALLSKSGSAGFDPSVLLEKNELKKVKRFLRLRFHPDKNIGNIQAAQADFLEATEALGTIESAEKADLVPALVAWKKSLKRAADDTPKKARSPRQTSAARSGCARSLAASTTATADAAEGRKDRSFGGTFSRLIAFVFLTT